MASKVNTDVTSGHIDAETLAAWAEHSLSVDAAAEVELHLSNCDRCQEVLAAFVRSEPVAGAPILPFWSRRPIQWSAAGLAAAAAIVAMIYIGRPPTAPTPETTVAEAPIDSLTPVAPSPAAASPAVASPDAATVGRQVREEKSIAGREDRAASAEKKVVAPKPASEVVIAAQSSPTASPRPVTVGAAAPPVSAPPPPAQMPIPQAIPSRPSPPPAVVAMSESVMRESVAFEVIAPDPSMSLARRSNDATGVGRGGGAAGGRGGAFASTIPARWRVTNGTQIERSIDAGKTWVAMELQPALTTRLAAGAATSQVVCWFVGENGVVVLTTDGRTLRRVSIPETIALVSVIAEDHLRATVMAADGRKFTTIDGGLTWK